MKSINELTDREIVELTEEQIQRYKDLACAETGVPFIEEVPKTPEFVDLPPPTEVVYHAGNNIRSKDKAAIEEIVDVLNKHSDKLVSVDYRWNVSSDKKFVRPLEDATASVIKEVYYSEDQYNALSSLLIKNRDLKTAHETARQAFEKNLEKRAEAHKDVILAIQRAYENVSRHAYLEREWKRYIDLAESNLSVAKNFFVKAFGTEAEDFLGNSTEVNECNSEAGER